MTGKERAGFRSQANTLEPLFQIGKGGVTDAVLAQLEDVFRTHELIKIKVHLESSPETPREVADKLSEKAAAEVIQVIGGVIVLYRYNEELHTEKPKPKKNVIPPSKRMSINSRKKLFAQKNKNK